MGYRAARRYHVLLMSWLTLTFVTAWLPLLRGAMDGPSYQWGAGLFGLQFGGAGIDGDYGFVLAKSAIALAFLWFGWRKPNGYFRPALVAWLALGLADTLFNVFTSPGSFRFQGDTLGVDISLVLIAPLLDAALLGLAVWWTLKAPSLPGPPLARANMVLVATFLMLIPVQYALLSAGSGQEPNDVVGVLLTLAGWFLLSAGLGLWRIGGQRPIRVAAAT
ncbi:MAG: hypothetical protein ACXWUN_11930 [Allosphingosinicella sp.]